MQRIDRLPLKVHRVVVVEDNLDTVHTLALLLREMGHYVDFAINGFVAYDVVRRFRPDTVICDLGLPGQSGFEVAQQIKKDPELQNVRLVALTAYDDENSRNQAKEAGFDEFFVKPIDPANLMRVLGDSSS